MLSERIIHTWTAIKQFKKKAENKMAKVTIQVKRPNGEIETVEAKAFNGMTEIMFEKIKKDTASTGRGECLSYHVDNTLTQEQKGKLAAQSAKAAWFINHGFSASDVS